MLRELITEEEYSAMNEYRDDYAFMGEQVNQNKASIKEVLSVWEDNKINLFKLFGNKLQISKDIDYICSEQELLKEMYKINNRYIPYTFGRENRSGYDFVQAWFDWVDSAFPYDFYAHNNEQSCRCGLIHLVQSAIGLVKNKFDGEPFTITLPNGKDYTVTKGCKPVKALGKIASAFGIPGFEDFRICHSLVLNDNRLKGTLTLSIHPLDYWTMSDNRCGWTSCMSWEECGSYRQGTVEMMNSPYVIVAYLSSAEAMKLGYTDFPWSNKKWRQLFIVDKDFAMGIKAYPYENDFLTKEILKWIAELGNKNMNYTWDDEFYHFTHHKIFNSAKEIIVPSAWFYTYHMYNDIGSCKKHWLLLNKNAFSEEKDLTFTFSGATQCVWCGVVDSHLKEAELCCSDCDEIYYCCCCNNVIPNDNERYIIDNEYYCYDCYCENVSTCSYCRKEYLNDDIKFIKIILKKKNDVLTIYEDYLSLCPDCYKKLKNLVPIYDYENIYFEDLQEYAAEFLPYSLRHINSLEDLVPYSYFNEVVQGLWEQTNNPF